ncbi:MAG: MarR family transcriptional regulator [Candidatus Aureabacteria bacterium]|nr:MarR family transcriptional regulator [Candidatus Auribacterota bacterium]
MAFEQKDNILLTFRSKAHEALISVWWTGILLKKESKKFFRPYIASEAQFNVLMILKYADKNFTQNDLSERLLVDKSNVTGLIDNMEKTHFIQRNRVKGDRRSYHISLTKKGKNLIDKLDKIYQKKVGEIMASLDERDCDDIIRLTKKLREGLFLSKEQ